MKRTTIGAVLAAGALLLAGCGSTGGNATAGTTVAPTTAASETMAPTTESPMETSAEAPTSEEMTTAEEMTSEDTDTGGNSTGSVDAQTTAWFDTLCGAIAPVKGLQDLPSQIDTSDPKKTLQAVSTAFSAVGAAYTDAATKLNDLPPPTFDGGDDFAQKAVTAFDETGPKMTALGEKIGKLDPTDPSSASELSTIQTDMADAIKPLQELQSTPGALLALSTVPSCKALSG